MANRQFKNSKIAPNKVDPGDAQGRAEQRRQAVAEATSSIPGTEGLDRKRRARRILTDGLPEDRRRKRRRR